MILDNSPLTASWSRSPRIYAEPSYLSFVVERDPPPKRELSITEVLRIHPDRSERPMGPDGIYSTDRGFVVRFRNDFDRSFAGFLEVQPMENIGVLAGPGPAVAVAARAARAGPATVSTSSAAPLGVAFQVPPGRSESRFDFSQKSADFPSGTFKVRVFDGAPFASLVKLLRDLVFASNVRFEASLLKQDVPGTTFRANVVVDASNGYSENARVRVRALADRNSSGLRAGDVIGNFSATIVVRERFEDPEQNAYMPDADRQIGRTPAAAKKGFFRLDGQDINQSGLQFAAGGPGGPGTQDFFAKSLRELTEREFRAKRLRPDVATIEFLFRGETQDRGSAGIPQWVDVIRRTRSGRTLRSNQMPDWADERAWDVLLRAQANLRAGSADPREAERADMSSSVSFLFPLRHGLRLPVRTIPFDAPAFTPPAVQTVLLNPWHPALRVDRPTLVRDQLDERETAGQITTVPFSNTVHHESRHTWQFLLTTIRQRDLVEAGVDGVVLVNNDLGQRGDDPDNDDDPRPSEKPIEGKLDDGDNLPERAFVRRLEGLRFVLTGDEYPDARSDRSPVVDFDDQVPLRFGEPVGVLNPRTGLYESDDGASLLERDAFDYGNEFERQE